MTSERRKRREIDSQARHMIASVYHFLREEYDFMKQNNLDNCDLSPLANVRKRTAEATGVSERTVTQVLKEEREAALNPTREKPAPTHKRVKGAAKKKLQTTSDNTDEDPSLRQGTFTQSIEEVFQIKSKRTLPQERPLESKVFKENDVVISTVSEALKADLCRLFVTEYSNFLQLMKWDYSWTFKM